MATRTDSTPARARALLPRPARPKVKPAAMIQAGRDPDGHVVHSNRFDIESVNRLEGLFLTIHGSEAAVQAGRPFPPLLSGGRAPHDPARADVMVDLLPSGGAFDLPEFGDLNPARARARHARTALEQAAEFGADLLSALDLQQLDALDNAIQVLDALDADTEDLEDGNDAEAVDEDGPIDDDELDDDGLSRGEADPADDEPVLGALEQLDQRLWSLGNSRDSEFDATDCIERNKPVDDCWAAHARRGELAALARLAQTMRRLIHPAPSRARDCDTLIPIGPGVMSWGGPGHG